MYYKLAILYPFLFPTKKMREARKEKKVENPVFNQIFMVSKLLIGS